jgi:tetratricopeptide (TPR) repeat protein
MGGVIEDRYRLSLSTVSAAARDAYVAGVDCILAATAGAEQHFGRAIEADPVFALAHAGLARAHFVVAKVPEARAAIARARELAAHATPREQAHVNALALAIEGKPVEAFAATREHLAQHPRDAMVLAPATGVFGLIGFSGRQEREPEQYEFLRGLARAFGEDWWFDTVFAFAACEDGRLDEARALIERSMAANPDNGHGAHIKAHVLYECGEAATGLEYLQGWLPKYDREALMHCHLSWHVALFALALGRADEAWQAYRSAVHPGGSWGPPLNVATDSVSFLWRAELAGQMRRADLWREVHEYTQRAFPKAGIAFVDVHTAFSCVANGDTAGLGGLAEELRKRLSAGRLPAGSVVPQLAEGLGAYGAGQWDRAAELLGKALPETVRIGGSRAQRDLIVKTLVAAYLKAGRGAEAQALLAQRMA